MKERLFRFKQFCVSHAVSAMKVGVDAVMLGAWADIEGVKKVVDVGCGCGVIALIVAQRAPDSKILAIDVDSDAVMEAKDNFQRSPWKERVKAKTISFDELIKEGKKFDMLISNPPFYDSGVNSNLDSRMKARHFGELSPVSLVRNASQILSEEGRLALICPSDLESKLLSEGDLHGLCAVRITSVKTTPEKAPKRILLEFCRKENKIDNCIKDTITIQQSAGVYTEEYINLTRDYYINF